VRDDVLRNYWFEKDVTMNGDVPWRGPREKAPSFMQMLVEALCQPGDVVVDCTASTGNSNFPVFVYSNEDRNYLIFIY